MVIIMNFIFDTSAFLMGLANRIIKKDIRIYTTPTVALEIKNKWIAEIFDMLVSSGLIKIVEPSKESLLKAESIHKQLGGKGVSRADLEIIALALELDHESTIVFTNDYSIQNILAYLGIKFASMKLRSIKEIWKWIKRCPTCKVYYPHEKTYCDICGTELRPVRRRIKTINYEH